MLLGLPFFVFNGRHFILIGFNFFLQTAGLLLDEARARVALEVVPRALARGQLASALVLLKLLLGGFLLRPLVGEEIGK